LGLALCLLSASCTTSSSSTPQEPPLHPQASLQRGAPSQQLTPLAETQETPAGAARELSKPARHVEPNNNRAQALALPFGVDVEGYVSPASKGEEGDQDWFVVEVPGSSASVLSVSLESPPDLDVVLEWMPRVPSSDKDKALIQADVVRKKPGNERLSNLRVDPGLVYLRVRSAWYRNKARAGSDEPYVLRADILPWAETIEAEPNHRIEESVLGTFNRPLKGSLGHIGDKDTWRIPLHETQSSRVQVRVTGVPDVLQELTLRWPNSKSAVMQARGSRGEGLTLRNISVPSKEEAPHLFISLKAVKGAAPRTTYELLIKPEKNSGDAHEAEPNDRSLKANTIRVNTPIQGHLAHAKDKDFFVLNVEESMSSNIRLTPASGVKASFELRSEPAKVSLSRSNSSPGSEVNAFGVGLTKGTWFIEIQGTPPDSENSYAFEVRESPESSSEREPNDSAESELQALNLGESSKGWLHPSGDVDFWSLTRSEEAGAGIVTFQIDPPKGVRLDVSLHALDGKELTGRRGLSAGQPGTFTHFLNPGRYTVRVSANTPSGQARDAYTLRLLD